MAELLVDRVYRACTLDSHELVDLVLNLLLGLYELGQVGREAGNLDLVAEVVLDSVGKHEVTISKTLHEGRSTETVSTVVREVGLTDSEETGDRGLQLVVNPDTTHGVVDSREDHHRSLVGVLVGDLLVHVEEVTITGTYYILTEALDSVLEVEEYSETSIVNTEAGIATLLGST